MNNGNRKVSDSYQDYLVDYIKENPQLAAAYLTETLAEKNPESGLLPQAINQIYTALLQENNPTLNDLLNSSEAEVIYKFVGLLNLMGFKIKIELSEVLSSLPKQEKTTPHLIHII